jgi:hypothetical protein
MTTSIPFTPERTFQRSDTGRQLSANPPVVLLSDTHQGDCVGSALTSRIDDIIENVGNATLTAIRIAGLIGNVATLTENVATDLFARGSTIYQLPLLAVSFTSKATSPATEYIVLLCSNILRANEVTFTERQMIFQYPFAPATMDFEPRGARAHLSRTRANGFYQVDFRNDFSTDVIVDFQR